MLRDTLGDGHNERNLGGDGLLDTGSSKRRRNEDGRGIGAGGLASFLNTLEDRLAQVFASSLLGVGTTDDVGAFIIVSTCCVRDYRGGSCIPYSMACWAWKLRAD